MTGATGSRTAAVWAFVLLGAGLLVAIAVFTPWHPLGHVPGGRTVPNGRLDFTPAQFAREQRFHAAIRPPAYASYAVSLLVALVLGLTPLGARLVGSLGRPGSRLWPLQVVLGALAVMLVGRLATLPFDIRAEQALRRFGLSTQTWASWTVDQLKGLGIGGGVGVLVLVGLLALLRRSPHWWWAWAAGGGAVLVVVLSFLYPVVVEPAFNTFHPLPAGQLRDDLLGLAARDHVHVSDVLVADASRRTTAVNAYVSGFGSTRRIVLYDTLLTSSTPAEVRLVVAHELGHAKRNDVLHGTLIGALAVAVAMCAAYLLLSSPGLLRRAGVDHLGDPRVVALLLALVAAAGAVTGPVQNLISRRIEARADVHALDLTHDAQTFVDSEHRLALTNLASLEPHPLAYALFATHPSTPERIALARDWAKIHGVAVPGPLVDTALAHGTGP